MRSTVVKRKAEDKTKDTDVAAPDVGGQYLVLLVEVEDLDQSDTVADVDPFVSVQDRTTDDPDVLIVAEQTLDENLLGGHQRAVCNRQITSRLMSTRLYNMIQQKNVHVIADEIKTALLLLLLLLPLNERYSCGSFFASVRSCLHG